MKSIRTRLTVFLLIGSGVLLLLSGEALNALVSYWLENEFDSALEAKARALVTLTKEEDGEVELDFADEFMPEFEAEVEPDYFQVWLAGGDVLERSRSLGNADLERHLEVAARPRFRDTPLIDGRRGRQVQIDFVPQIEDDDLETALDPTAANDSGRRHATIVVAKSRHRLNTTVKIFRVALLTAGAILMAAIYVLVRTSIRAGLRPLQIMAGQVEALDAESLKSRLDISGSPTELTPLIEKLNALLARLDDAFDRERQLSSDIAHELRTPIAELRNLAEVGERWPDDREATQRFFEDVRQIARQMEGTIADLLALARTEGGIEGIDVRDVLLRGLLERVWSRLESEESEDSQLLCNVPSTLMVRTDPEKLERILVNLLGNAARYSPDGAVVNCSTIQRNGRATLTIANQTYGLTKADLPKMFERFWRKDTARTSSQNAGLGLSLVKAFADLLELDLQTSLDSTQAFHVSLTAPISQPDP